MHCLPETFESVYLGRQECVLSVKFDDMLLANKKHWSAARFSDPPPEYAVDAGRAGICRSTTKAMQHSIRVSQQANLQGQHMHEPDRLPSKAHVA